MQKTIANQRIRTNQGTRTMSEPPQAPPIVFAVDVNSQASLKAALETNYPVGTNVINITSDISISNWVPVDSPNENTSECIVKLEGNGHWIRGLNDGLMHKCPWRFDVSNLNINVDISLANTSDLDEYWNGVSALKNGQSGAYNGSRFENITVTGKIRTTDMCNVCGVVSGNMANRYVPPTFNALFRNCKNYADITCEYDPSKTNVRDFPYVICGICSSCYGVDIYDCVNYGNITVIAKNQSTLFTEVAGIVCHYYAISEVGQFAEMANCINYGNLTLDAENTTLCRVSGLASSSEGGLISYCSNYGALKLTMRGSNREDGSVTGLIDGTDSVSFLSGTSSVVECYNFGDLSATFEGNTRGNVSGIMTYANNQTVENCVNSGDITVTTDAADYIRVSGIVYTPRVTDTSLLGVSGFFNCINEGNIDVITSSSSTEVQIAGIGGTVNKVNVEKCVNNGQLRHVGTAGNVYIGGIARRVDSEGQNVRIFDCVNHVDVLSDNPGYVGGIAADIQWSATIHDCVNYGNIKGGDGAFVGGIVGIARNSSNIINCFSVGGKILNGTRVGGIIGRLEDSTVECCYSSTDVISTLTDGIAGGIAGVIAGGATVRKSSTGALRISAPTVSTITDVGKIYGYAAYRGTEDNPNVSDNQANPLMRIAGVIATTPGDSVVIDGKTLKYLEAYPDLKSGDKQNGADMGDIICSTITGCDADPRKIALTFIDTGRTIIITSDAAGHVVLPDVDDTPCQKFIGWFTAPYGGDEVKSGAFTTCQVLFSHYYNCDCMTDELRSAIDILADDLVTSHDVLGGFIEKYANAIAPCVASCPTCKYDKMLNIITSLTTSLKKETCCVVSLIGNGNKSCRKEKDGC